MRVLVVAPRFPSINQPWIDTYLEQMLAHAIEPAIFSVNRRLTPYQDKVDLLDLKAYVIPLELGRVAMVCSQARQLLHLDELPIVWHTAKRLAASVDGFLASIVKGNHFLAKSTTIGPVDVIHSHAEHMAYDFLHLAIPKNIPLILTFHGLPPTGIGQLATKKRRVLYRYTLQVLVNTEFAKKQVCSLGCAPEKVKILPQGLPLVDFPFSDRLAPPSEGPVSLLTVGRYHRDKGQGYALLALRRLLDRGVQAHWYFVGVGPDRYRLARMMERLQLKENVTFLEGISGDQLRMLYHDCHLFVLPSISSPGGHVETQGVVLQEAQASGCIPIASRVGGIPECVNHQRDAILIKERSSRSIADAVQYLLARPEEWASYQEAGRRNVEENYSADVIGQKMAALLRSVVESWTGYDGMPVARSKYPG